MYSVVVDCYVATPGASSKNKGRGKKSRRRIAEIADMEADTLESAAATEGTHSAAASLPDDVPEGNKLGVCYHFIKK